VFGGDHHGSNGVEWLKSSGQANPARLASPRIGSNSRLGDKMSIVYILTNEAMPGYIKIGRTGTSVEQRMKELHTTSVPLPFQCYYAAKVEDDVVLERALHSAFDDYRIQKNREFFKLDPYKAKVVIELLAIEDVTPKSDLFEDSATAEAVQKASKYSGKFNFVENHIPIGSELEYYSDRTLKCTVFDETSVLFDGKVVSTSRAAVLANAKRGGTATAISGTISWVYEGKTISLIREERLAALEIDKSEDL
jgi:hypothetical protein